MRGGGGGTATPPSSSLPPSLDYAPRSDGAVTAEAAAAALAGVRMCRHCSAEQPARASHCKACNRCVATFDHHCSVVGTCVGERNRCRFLVFLLGQVAGVAFCIGVLQSGVMWRRTYSAWAWDNATAVGLLCLLWPMQALLFGLLCFHIWLAATNTTTYETVVGASRLWYLAGTQPRDCDLPFSRGLCRNLHLYCCLLDGWREASSAAACRAALSGAGGGSGGWSHRRWELPGPINRDSPDIVNNLWENAAYSCC